jgi:hypothetical protein
VRLFKPRRGYRTRVAPDVLGPQIEYYLPSPPADAVTLEILDGSGKVVNAYSSEGPPRGRGGRAGADADDPEASGGGRGRSGVVPRVLKAAGLNRFVWDVRNSAGVTMPPALYTARLSAAGVVLMQPFTVGMDPNVAADGVTVADLQEQFDHNMRMRRLVDDVNGLVTRVREAQTRAGRGDSGLAVKARELDAVAGELLTEPVRYGKPGLQAHITYLASMTIGADQKIGKDAAERYAVLKKELDRLRGAFDQLMK